MQDAIALDARHVNRRRLKLRERARACAPTLPQFALAALSSLLLILSFPDFNLWWLAWVGLTPLLYAVCALPQPRPSCAFVLGWVTGTLYFYGTCWWLTHSMIHYGGIPAFVAFPLLAPVTVVVGLFPALCCLIVARVASRWNTTVALCVAPFAWTACEWARLVVTGQLWNAVGYTQAYHPTLIQSASWGGVYAISFLILTINSAITYALLRRNSRAMISVAFSAIFVAFVIVAGARSSSSYGDIRMPSGVAAWSAVVVAIQPNVSPNFERTQAETDALVARHLTMATGAFKAWDAKFAQSVAQGLINQQTAWVYQATPRVIIFPESPMNFEYARDAEFRELISDFARQERASVLFNSLEPAPAGGAYNSAVLVNEEGRLVAQYDKIRLLPFGEYVPLPRWLGGGLFGGLVGEFTPGANYTLLPLGQARAGVFICFESAFPAIARTFTDAGADVLINISNDGYLGRTPVLRQHLANAIFRAVENRRTILRVTNTGITARITPRGEVQDATDSFQPVTRTWTITRAAGGKTFYTRHGDLFVALCTIVTTVAFALSFVMSKPRTA
ncbi:MAG: apolipoprotein N-acyltransferase [Acidobacteriota bacterium]|nr:apolipoprotein N-acyltransferase [Acidobacteriota bacterium]